MAYDMVVNRPVSLQLNESSDLGIGIDRKMERKRKKRRAADAGVKRFLDLYKSTGESLGEGAFGQVKTYKNVLTHQEFAVKVIEKGDQYSRRKVLKEIEIFHYCHGHENILQLVEYFEEDDRFYLIFEKMEGGTLLDCILCRGHLTEQEASLVIRDIAKGLEFLHKKGIAHRDLKPENILCGVAGQLIPVKICDFDLGSGVHINSRCTSPVTTPELLSPVGSADFMAPEVVDVWVDQAWSYDKRCDLWSLGIILYILLSGYRPFYANCGNNCGFNEGKPCLDCQQMICSQEDEPGTSKSTCQIAREMGIGATSDSVLNIAKLDLGLSYFRRKTVQVINETTRLKRLMRCKQLIRRLTVNKVGKVFLLTKNCFTSVRRSTAKTTGCRLLEKSAMSIHSVSSCSEPGFQSASWCRSVYLTEVREVFISSQRRLK